MYLFKCSCSCRWNKIFLTQYLLHAWKTLRYVWFPVLLWTSFIIHDRSKASQIYHIFVHVIIEHLNWYLGQLNTLLPLTSGLWVACLLNCFSDRFSIQYKKLHLIYLGFIRDDYWFCLFSLLRFGLCSLSSQVRVELISLLRLLR